MNQKLSISILLILTSLNVIAQELNEKPTKPLGNILFDRNGNYFILHTDWLHHENEIIYNPYTIENYKNDLIITRKTDCTTPQLHFLVVKNNHFEKFIEYCNESEISMSPNLKKSFSKVNLIEKRRLSKVQYLHLVDSLNENGTLWYGDELKEYDGEFAIEIKIAREFESKSKGLDIEENIYQKIFSLYPNLRNRIEVMFSSSNPTDPFVIYEISIRANEDYSNVIKSIELKSIEIIQDYSIGRFEENSYGLTIINFATK